MVWKEAQSEGYGAVPFWVTASLVVLLINPIESARGVPFDIDYIIPYRNEPSYLLWFTLAITANEESKNINT